MTVHHPDPVVAPPGPLFEDDFRQGLLCDGPARRWELRSVEDLPRGDGLVSGTADGLVVLPASRNATTGEPAFTRPADPAAKTEFLRWAAFADRTTADGGFGFAVRPGEVLSGTVEYAVRTYGTEHHPLGDAVTDHNADMRLGAGALISIDRETGLVFDFVQTNTAIHALYERLPRPGSDHATFSYGIPVGTREPDTFHTCTVSLDPGKGVVRWILDGREVLAVDRIGHKVLDPARLLWEAPGEERTAVPRQLNFGLSTFAGKVWGQGVRLAVRRLTVSSAPAGAGA
ncbi:hypothetical protein GA0115240_122415 [Streptomyces sp. DvalAA-14]|uniref:DUF6081 family protein n=1 Tax=unclassified Streptomyces TaxID=2593676 RepID=UPI00081B9119|nr:MULTISPECIES: DUF6081 family protein [unclassified Streptomyces]MYS20713.1 hypothetical protein [Streptomyces sp. SID4948]SCD75300.1 hypothetical protein GA0115240_122415 [Streptomyces sp. DvalAA-14]